MRVGGWRVENEVVYSLTTLLMEGVRSGLIMRRDRQTGHPNIMALLYTETTIDDRQTMNVPFCVYSVSLFFKSSRVEISGELLYSRE